MDHPTAPAPKSKTGSIVTRIALVSICLICYVLLIILYCAPHIYHLQSLVIVNSSTPKWRRLKPTVVVGLLSAILSAATTALITKAVDNSLWLKLSPETTRNHLTVRESLALARWTVSASSRIQYMALGRSWLLRFATPFLLATSIVGPVLLSGISPKSAVIISNSKISATEQVFSGYIDPSDIGYNGGDSADNLHIISALGFMSNLSAPAAQVCTSPSCSITAKVAAIMATCGFDTHQNSTGSNSDSSNATFQSVSNPELYVTVSSGYPFTFVNFTTGYPSSCTFNYSDSCNGLWSNVFGAWINAVGEVHTVDCKLEYGNVTVSQISTSSPSLDRSSFSKSTFHLSRYDSAVSGWHRIYDDLADFNSPYTFTAMDGGQENTLYQNTFALFLLNYDKANSSSVASRLEGNFDAATLAAFARAPSASDIYTTITTSVQNWAYSKTVLAILLVPLLATVLAGWDRWIIVGETYLGYDPVGIAAIGPVAGLSSPIQNSAPKAEGTPILNSKEGSYVAGKYRQDHPEIIEGVTPNVDQWTVRGVYDEGSNFKLVVSP